MGLRIAGKKNRLAVNSEKRIHYRSLAQGAPKGHRLSAEMETARRPRLGAQNESLNRRNHCVDEAL